MISTFYEYSSYCRSRLLTACQLKLILAVTQVNFLLLCLVSNSISAKKSENLRHGQYRQFFHPDSEVQMFESAILFPVENCFKL